MHWIDFMAKLEPLLDDLEVMVQAFRAAQEQGKLPPAPEKAQDK
jgi:hypothetical protein